MCTLYSTVISDDFLGYTYSKDDKFLLCFKASDNHFIRCLLLKTPRLKFNWTNEEFVFNESVIRLKLASSIWHPLRDNRRTEPFFKELHISSTSTSFRSSPVIWIVPSMSDEWECIGYLLRKNRKYVLQHKLKSLFPRIQDAKFTGVPMF